MVMNYTILPHRTLLRLSGDDTVSFLQGLVTNDVTHMQEGEVRYSAMLSPQGKFLHDFFIIYWQGTVWIDCDTSRIDDLRKRLTLYRLRSKVDIAAAPDMTIAAAWGEGTLATAVDVCVFRDPRHPALGQRMIGRQAALEAYMKTNGTTASDVEAYESMRISFGMPDGVQDMVFDKSLLLEFGFEALHGVDFKKGCYVGQEVTARSKYRGQVKKSLYQVSALSGSLPASGTEIRAGEVLLGEMRSSAGGKGLALLRMAELDEAIKSGAKLVAGDAVIMAQLPQWLAVAVATDA
jgi:folate-binding protein YgfZ